MRTFLNRLFCNAVLMLVISGLAPRSARADALDNWTAASFNTNNFFLLGITYGNGRYVAVGAENAIWDFGTIVTSEDGHSWTVRRTGSVNFEINELFDVTYGNGTFVAVGWDWYGGRNLYHSTNGINWNSHTSSIANFYGVAWGGGLFVAVGDGLLLESSSTTTSENIYISDDGADWYPVDSEAAVPLRDVAYGAGKFVVVDDVGGIYTSSDGDFWSSTINSRAGNSVSFCRDRFFVSAGAGTNLVSADGSTWTLLPNNTGNTFSRVVYAAGVYAALSGTNVFTSADGTNWIGHNVAVPNTQLRDLAFGAGGSLAIVGYTNGVSQFTALQPRAYVSDPSPVLGIKPGFPLQLKISGLQGRSYRVDYRSDLQGAASNWHSLTTFPLTNSPQFWTDASATNSQRFYRAVLLP